MHPPSTMLTTTPYRPIHQPDWESLLQSSRNGTFMHSRNYMDYHRDRFEDCSVIIHQDGRPVAIFPAHWEGGKVYSHKGLTFGGLVLGNGVGDEEMEKVVGALIDHFRREEVSEIHIKCIPDFYLEDGQDRLRKALLKFGATLTAINIIHAVPLPSTIGERADYKIRNSQRISPEIRKADSFQPFWEKVLIPHLYNKFGNRPVHSLQEITQLGQHNPIEQWDLYHEGELLAGTTLFVDKHVVKAQYTATTERGRKLKALDYLFFHLFDLYGHKKLFNLGTSYHPGTRELVPGLVHWKKSFGALPYESDNYVIIL
ncbi:hypothetical protein KIH41_17930 [Litoribacter ruber]|uniref:hypothetical protein n=1 Tax=Litoribacter ruber TaxID=702568 RepID=UPI001BDB4E96|nr:hypothetical protein [Litoribacter ruber]MBT0813167.1 hypothetical protein [Litoribacter ruber]